MIPYVSNISDTTRANYLPDNSDSWHLQIEEHISICLLKGTYVSSQSPKLIDRVKQLYIN